MGVYSRGDMGTAPIEERRIPRKKHNEAYVLLVQTFTWLSHSIKGNLSLLTHTCTRIHVFPLIFEI